MTVNGKKLWESIRQNRYLLLALTAGIALLLIPSGKSAGREQGSDISTQAEQRLAGALSSMDGVGKVYVLLSGDGTRGNSFSGAVIICEGAGEAAVRLRIMESVSAFTGLGSDKIVIQKFNIIGGTE